MSRVTPQMVQAALVRGRLVRSDSLAANLGASLRNYAQLWEKDRVWAGGASLTDMRQPIICGGGGCNLPYGTSQFWRIDSVPCMPDTLATVLFQIDRYGLAQNYLSSLLSRAPGPIPTKSLSRRLPNGQTQMEYSLADARRVQAQATQWAQWVVDVWRGVAVAQWASNARWWMIKNADRPIVTGPRGDLAYRTGESGYLGVGPSWNVCGLDQMGEDGKYRGAVGGLAREGSGANKLPPIVATRVPVQITDFDPQFLFYSSPQAVTPFRQMYGRPSYSQRIWPAHWGAAPTGDIVAQVAALLQHAPDYPSDTVRFMHPDTFRVQTMPAAQVPVGVAPTSGHVILDAQAELLDVITQAESEARYVVSMGFGSALERATLSFSKFYEKMPQNMRMLSVGELDDVMRAIRQAQLDEASAMFAAGAGAVTSIVAAINPIAGVVVAVVAAVIGLLIRFAQEVGLDRSANPPCPPAPYLRLIPATATTAACDFDLTRNVPIGTIAAKVSTIGRAAAANIRPEQWFDALDQIEREQPPAIDRSANSNNARKAFAAMFGSAAGLALAKFLITGRL